MTTTEENKAQFRRLYEEMLNKGDVSVVDELIAPDFFNHAAPAATNRGPSSLRWLATMLRTAFPDLRFTIEELVAEGDIVAGRLSMSGTHEAPLMGMSPPSGRAVRQEHMHFVRYRDGKAVEHWVVRDDLSMMQQLGVIPEPGQPRESEPTVRSPNSIVVADPGQGGLTLRLRSQSSPESAAPSYPSFAVSASSRASQC